MNEELESLELNHTWEVTDLPPQRKAIGSKWLYKTKFNADGSLDKYKARLVILGNHQRPGEDYNQTFAPVAKMTTVRSLLAVAALQGWDIQQMDVKNAFLHGDLEEDVYIKLPLGYSAQGTRIQVLSEGESYSPAPTIQVCKLHKSLYGLKQAPRQWFSKLSTTLQGHQFVQSKNDYSLFIKRQSDTITIILVYVDDLLIAGNNSDAIAAAK